MELEKTLFRVHERLLQHRVTKPIILVSMLISLFIAMYYLIVFIFANVEYEGKPACSKHIKFSHNFNETFYEFSVENYDLVMFASSERELITLNSTLLEKHQFTKFKQKIPLTCFFSNKLTQIVISYTIGMENILINELIWNWNQKHGLYIRNNNTNEMWGWSAKTFQKYNSSNIILRMLIGLLELWKILVALFLQSSIASLYIKITIVCSPIFIIPICNLNWEIILLQDIQLDVLYQAFPWIGIYLNILDRNNRRKTHLLNAFLFLLVFFYFLYLSTVFIGSFLLFYKSIPSRLDENFFGFLSVVEFVSMLFFRTRSTLYFAPILIMVQYVIYFYYLQQTIYGFFYLGFYIVIFFNLFVIFFFIYFFEIPSLSWNQQSPYTPSIDRPRCFYIPLFQLGWTGDLPHLWTMFYPLHGRRFFNHNQLAYVDRNFILLNHQLNQGNQIEIEMNVMNPPQHQAVAQQPVQPQGDQNQHIDILPEGNQ